MNPIEQSKYIEKEFREYVKSTFQIEDEEYEKCFKKELDEAVLCKGPFISSEFPFEKGESIRTLVEKNKISKEFLNLSEIKFDQTLYYHQQKSLEIIGQGHNAVITTGTGSGKTESFLYPILNHILREIENGEGGSGIRALFLYPMNALVNDQMERIREILKDYPQITFGSFTGETVEEGGDNLRKKLSDKYGIQIPPNEIVSREEIRKSPPNLLFTNYSMLEYLLIRPNDFNIFSEENIGKWQFVVLDEAHTYTGALGIEISVLLRRVSGIANRKPQFILTSATLGDDKEDSINSIIDFAESLTTSKFNKEDIIFAKRIPLNNMYIKYSIEPKIYSKIINNFENLENVKNLIKEYGDFSNCTNIKEILFDLLIQDKNLYLISKELKSDRIKTFKEILNKLNESITISEQELVDFIQLISKANKNNRTLFDSKYHTFVRTLDGAFITIGNTKKMKLTNHKDIDGMKAFEIGLCKYCNQMYLIGKEFNGTLYQNSDIDIDENYGDIENTDVDYYLLKDKAIIDEKFEESVKEHVLCSKCGKIYLKTNINAEKCNCGDEHLVEVYKVCNEKSEVKNNITTCPCCTRHTTNGSGIVSGFHLNKDSATALLSQILYETISVNEENEENANDEEKLIINFFGDNSNKETQIKKKKIKEGKQIIAFSDSRQQASFFATFFEYTHNRFLRKRVLWEELIKNEHNPIKVEKLPAKLEKEISDKKLFDTSYTPFVDAWICIMNELLNIDGNYTAEAIGIFAFELDEDIINEILKKISNFEDGLSYFGLNKEEFIIILKVVFNIFRNSSALLYTESDITKPIKDEEFGYRKFDNCVVEKKEGKTNSNVTGDNRHSFLPVENSKAENQAYNYVKRILKNKSNDEIIALLKAIFDIGKNGIFTEEQKKDEKVYRIDAKKYVLKSYKKMQYYYCPVCEKITQYNVRNICPTKFCNGILEKIDPDEKLKNNYYRKEYMNKKIERVVVKEHTAQLNKDTGREYQKLFKEKKINVLSCSTTFEMGIDIGKLENVFLRNVPPTPANYAQRAGRAGRRNDSSAFVLTFCGSNSHDYTYFEDPSKMIAGHIMPPKLKITNEKIILRHIMASCLGFFFRSNPEYFLNIENLVCNNGIEEFKKYLGSRPQDLDRYINEKILDDNIRKDYQNYKWIGKLLNEGSDLETFYATTLNRINELTEAEENATLNKEYDKAKYFSKEVDKIKSSKVINTLSSNCVIPKYGFPVDVVELNIYENGKQNDKYNLSRDLSVAISEYAPDSEIIVDDKKYTSRYILKPRSQNHFSLYYYYKCKNCERMNVQESMTNKIEFCQYCNTKYDDIISNYYIEPIYGFATGQENDRTSRTKRPRKTYSGDYEYLGGGISNDDKFTYNNYVTIESAKDDKLLVLNSNPFFKCNVCGYTVLDKKKATFNTITKAHKNYLGYSCENGNNDELRKVALGHTFKTDVIKISIIGLIEKRKALSTLYALIEGISEAFDIERKDINGIINKKENNEYELIIFDNVPGGAGHVKRILESNNLKLAFRSAYKKVNMQCCDENTSCYNCLRNFNNQRVHKDLKRKYAKDVLKSVLNCIDNENKEIEPINLKESIDYNRSYSLEGYNTWDEVEVFIDGVNIFKFEKEGIKIPDYSDSYIKLPNRQNINLKMIWIDKNIVIINNEEDKEILERYGLIVYTIENIDFQKLK